MSRHSHFGLLSASSEVDTGSCGCCSAGLSSAGAFAYGTAMASGIDPEPRSAATPAAALTDTLRIICAPGRLVFGVSPPGTRGVGRTIGRPNNYTDLGDRQLKKKNIAITEI